MKCAVCSKLIGDGEEIVIEAANSLTGLNETVCSVKCAKAASKVAEHKPPQTVPETEKPTISGTAVLTPPPASEPPTARTRKTRADKGKPRATKAGQFVLQELDAANVGDINKWKDRDNFATEAKAWNSVTSAGTYRVVRIHGQPRTAKEQTVITFE